MGAFLFLAGAVIAPAALVMVVVTKSSIYVLGILAGGSAIGFAGLWQLTSRNPSPVVFERRWSQRFLLRIVAILTSLVVSGWCVLYAMGPLRVPMRASTELTLVVLLGISWVICMPVRTCLIGLYLQDLARRLPDDMLAQRIWLITWCLIGSFALYVGLSLMFGMGMSNSEIPGIGFVCSSVFIPLFALIYLWGLWLIGKLAWNLRAAAAEAEVRHRRLPPRC